jgi:thiol-disulfide isomerase/thioredoxin
MARAALLMLALAGCGGDVPADRPADASARVEVVGLEQLDQELAAQQGHPLLVNFWAMWCVPCVAELPDLLAVAREHRARGLRLLLVSYDLMAPASPAEKILPRLRTFLAERGIDVPVLVYDAPDLEAIDRRFAFEGGIPVTLAFDRAGKIVDREDGAAGRERFAELARRALGD